MIIGKSQKYRIMPTLESTPRISGPFLLCIIKELFLLSLNPNGLLEIPCLRLWKCKSSFVNQKKCVADDHKRQAPHRMQKKILFAVPPMHGLPNSQENSGKEFLWELVSDDCFDLSISSHKSPENDRFLILGSMVPAVCKVIHFKF